MSFSESIALGIADSLIPNLGTIHKFGNASDIDTADITPYATIWDGTCSAIPAKIAQYTYSSTANIDTLSSTNAGDTQEIVIQGLDADWNLVTQSKNLTGQTAALLDTPLIRVFRMYNNDTTNIAGTVYLATNGRAATGGQPTLGTTVRAIIKDGDNQTQMALYTVPANHKLVIEHGWTSISKNTTPAVVATLQIRIFQRSLGKVFRVVHTLSLNTNGSSNDQRPYGIPIVFDEKTDIEYRVTACSSDNMGASAGFHGMLIQK